MWPFLAGAIGLAAAVAAIDFRDRRDNMTLLDMTSFNTQRTEKGFRFRAKGDPLRASWKSQGLRFVATSIEGEAERDAERGFELKRATLDGIREAEFGPPDGSPRARFVRLSVVKLEYDREGEVASVVSPGAIRLVSQVPARRETFELQGSSARLEVVPIGREAEDPLRSGTVAGPVRMKLETLNVGRPEDPADDESVTVEGRADRLEIAEFGRLLTLSGNVELRGTSVRLSDREVTDDAVLGGSVTRVERAVLRLDRERRIVEVELSAENGRTELSSRRARP